MKNRVDILIDTSGSMAEDGKYAVIQNLIYTISRVLKKDEYKSYQVNILQWSENIEVIRKVSDLQFSGRISSVALKEYLDNEEAAQVILLISDGNFSNKEKNIFKNSNSKYFYCMAVGLDADTFTLKKIASSGYVFEVPNIMSALKKVCNRCIEIDEEDI